MDKVIARALLVREWYAQHEQKKYGVEWGAQDIMVGFVGDVGDLSKIVMGKEGKRDVEDVNKRLSHELADCLWSVIILANKYNIDLEKAFFETMDVLEVKISQS